MQQVQRIRMREGYARRQASDGFSLIEIMVATVVMVIIFIGWLRIANFQAVRKESLRRAAIEKAAGYLDFIFDVPSLLPNQYYRVSWTNGQYEATHLTSGKELVQPLFEEFEAMGYTLQILEDYQTGWSPSPGLNRWAVIRLYDQHDVLMDNAGRPFSTMSIFLR